MWGVRAYALCLKHRMRQLSGLDDPSHVRKQNLQLPMGLPQVGASFKTLYVDS